MARKSLTVLGLCLVLLLNTGAAVGSQTGYFTTDFQDGRWWLIDPDQNRFFSTGVNVVHPGAYVAPDLGYAPYEQYILSLYGDYQTWSDTAYPRLTAWGFNTLGAWSHLGLNQGRMYYTVKLNMADSDWLTGDVADYFSDDWYDNVDDIAATIVAPLADDPMLIGYFLDNEVRWGSDWRGLEDLFAIYFSMDETAPGKIALVDFLADRYSDDVSAFETVWNMGISDFSELLPMTQIDPIEWDPTRKADRQAFEGFVADHFFSYTDNALRTYDTNHLNLGIRFVSWITPRPVVEAAANYVDVVSINHYLVWPAYHGIFGWLEDLMGWMHTDNMLEDYCQTTDLPFMISEFSIRALDAGLPSTWPPNYFFLTAQTQDERADIFEQYARETFATGYCVGYHWFAYMDEPPEGRFDGENSNFGLVDNYDEPWTTLVNRMTAVNADALTWPLADDDDDDDVVDDDDDTVDDDDDVVDDDDDTSDDDDDVADDDDDSIDDDDDSADDDTADPTSSDDDDEGCCG